MNRTRAALAVVVAALSLATRPVVGQGPVAPQHPNFAGTWEPSDPAKSLQLFRVGLSVIPGHARLIIEQRPDRLTLTISMQEDDLTAHLNFNGRFYSTIIYRVSELAGPGRPGGGGAGGMQPPLMPTWVGDQLEIPNPRPAEHPVMETYSLDNGFLKIQRHVDLQDGRANNITELFNKVK